jgi:hypothetical protein
MTMQTPTPTWRASSSRALQREPVAVRSLIEAVSPVIQTRVARALLRPRSTRSQRRSPREVKNLTQEVFLALSDSDSFRDVYVTSASAVANNAQTARIPETGGFSEMRMFENDAVLAAKNLAYRGKVHQDPR